MVVDGDEVDEEGEATDQGREEGGTKQHLLDPFLSWDAHIYEHQGEMIINIKGGHNGPKDMNVRMFPDYQSSNLIL